MVYFEFYVIIGANPTQFSFLNDMIKLKNLSLQEIHRIILASKCLMEASYRLEVHEKTLATHLAKTTFVDEEGNSIPLSYTLLKTGWPTEAEAEQALGMLYKQVMNTQAIPLAQRTMRTIHQTICNSKSILGAATSLGVYSSSL